MTRNLERPAAARFAFLMTIPIMLAAGLLASLDVIRTSDLESTLLIFIPGFIAAALTGYLAIRWLLRYLMQHTLYDFAIYCVALGLFVLLVSLCPWLRWTQSLFETFSCSIQTSYFSTMAHSVPARVRYLRNTRSGNASWNSAGRIPWAGGAQIDGVRPEISGRLPWRPG